MQIHEQQLVLALRPLKRVHESLGHKPHRRRTEFPREFRDEIRGLRGGGGEGDQAFRFLAPVSGEPEKVEGSGEDAAGDPDAEADGAGDEPDAAGDDVEWEGHELPDEAGRGRVGPIGAGGGRGCGGSCNGGSSGREIWGWGRGGGGEGGDGELEVPVVRGEDLGAEIGVVESGDGLEVGQFVLEALRHR